MLLQRIWILQRCFSRSATDHIVPRFYSSVKSPFCVLDEVDAALDEVNLLRFLELMKKIKDQTQFIIITHNTKTMEVADYIHGTTMAEPNITSLYSIQLEQKKKKAS